MQYQPHFKRALDKQEHAPGQSGWEEDWSPGSKRSGWSSWDFWRKEDPGGCGLCFISLRGFHEAEGIDRVYVITGQRARTHGYIFLKGRFSFSNRKNFLTTRAVQSGTHCPGSNDLSIAGDIQAEARQPLSYHTAEGPHHQGRVIVLDYCYSSF